MRTLQVGYTDVIARRFNGHDLHHALRGRGIESQHCVWAKSSADPATWELAAFRGRHRLRSYIERFEDKLSVQSLLYPFSGALRFNGRFKAADVVHYHIIHTGYFSIASLPSLSAMKPSVWTIHDLWAATGHCVYPGDCDGWKNGCGDCPRLETHFPMRRDHTAFMWNTKRKCYGKADLDVILASKWMLGKAEQSPLLSDFRLHHIPFGLDLEKFRPMNQEEAKLKFGINSESLVICFRATGNEFKGLSYVKECLRRLKTDRPICLLVFDDEGLMGEFKDRYQVVDLGWVDDEDVIVSAYNAADIFLMPSTAEAFGLMAMEVMACGKPVIVFEDTSLPEVVFAPEGGVAVPMGDTDALVKALEMLIDNPNERLKIGERALKLAREHYDFDDHVDKVLALYEEAIARKKADER